MQIPSLSQAAWRLPYLQLGTTVMLPDGTSVIGQFQERIEYSDEENVKREIYSYRLDTPRGSSGSLKVESIVTIEGHRYYVRETEILSEYGRQRWYLNYHRELVEAPLTWAGIPLTWAGLPLEFEG